MDEKGRELCPRLLDFLVVVGRRAHARLQPHSEGGFLQQLLASAHAAATSSSSAARPESPQKSRRAHGGVSTPALLRRYPSENHSDFALPHEMVYFCQPEGCVTVGSAQRQLQHFIRDTTSFVFTLTEKDSAKVRYGVSLNFFLHFEQRKSPNTLKGSAGGGKRRHPQSSASLTSLCLISHHPFLTAFRDLLTTLRQLIDACNHRCNQLGDGAPPRDAVWSVLMGHWPAGLSIPTPVMQEIRQLETWILTLLSSPVPVPGKTKVLLEALPLDVMPMFEFALPDHTRFSLVDFPLHLPLELLGVDVVAHLLAAIMQEYKVVLVSRNYNAVSMCVLALVALLYPLEYMFPIIPLLPVFMPSSEQLLLAPTPYIIGLPSSFFAVKEVSLPSDVLMVDLDSNTMTLPQGLHIPLFPEPEATNLKDAFRRALNRRTLQQSEAGQPIDEDEMDVAARVAMVQFYNSGNVFANFSEHTRTLRLYPRPVVALQGESFLRSRPVQSEFIAELCRTQAVEYFAECCLSPRNETYVRVQTGITAAAQVGDKSKWFSEQLMPIHFDAYPHNSTLTEALFLQRVEKHPASCSGSEDESDVDSRSNCSGMDESLYSDSSYDSKPSSVYFEKIKPIGEVNDVYRAPSKLELPQSESAHSVVSSVSSGRSSPSSSAPHSAMGSEADFARLAENLAIKSDSRGDLQLDRRASREQPDEWGTPHQRRRVVEAAARQSTASLISSTSSTPTLKSAPPLLAAKKEKAADSLMDAFNGYAEKSQGVLTKLFHTPKAQALRDKAVRPLAEAAASQMEHGQHLMHKKAQGGAPTNSSATANTQRKNQQLIAEACDQILADRGIGVFAYPKVRRLLEDESLRELACSKLNLGLEARYSEDEYVQDIQLTRARYKGYLKLLQACLLGLETSFDTPGSNGLASLFHALELAHTHFWMENEPATPGSGVVSVLNTPSASSHSLLAGAGAAAAVKAEPHAMTSPPSAPPPPLPPPPREAEAPVSNGAPTTAPPPPPPLPPRQPSSSPRPPLPRRPPPPQLPTAEVNGLNAQSIGEEHSARPDDLLLATAPAKAVPTSLPLAQAASAPPPAAAATPKPSPAPDHIIRHFLYVDLLVHSSTAAALWQNPTFWEAAFLDMVAQEREIIGMDMEPSELIGRYARLSESERRRLEMEEDRILATLLHNLTAYMVMCGTGVRAIQQKVRRLLGKAHIGLVYSKMINCLLDDLPSVQTNGIPLKPLESRLVKKQVFAVHTGCSEEGSLVFFEVCDDTIILRAVTGAVLERWWYERLVNMTYSPTTHVLCVWRRQDDQVHMHKFFKRHKCRELYSCMRKAMQRAAARGKVPLDARNLGGEFPVHDVERNEGGLMQVRMDGLTLSFADRQEFIELANIKKCNAYGGNMFALEEIDRTTNAMIQRRYVSTMADQICYAVLCVFSRAATRRSPSVEPDPFSRQAE